MPEEPIKLLLVDDHPIVRNGLRQVQEIDPGLKVIGGAATMELAMTEAFRLCPDVVVMDIRLPDGDGIEACRQIKSKLPQTRILFLTSYADNNLILQAMEAGADGYLLKENDAQKIVDAIRSILRGDTVFDPVVTRKMVLRLTKCGPASSLDSLTSQERRVLEQVAQGRTDKEVATALGLTAKTARNYLDRIFTKLNVHTRTEAALMYARLIDK